MLNSSLHLFTPSAVVYEMSERLEVDFYLLYACVGLFASLFVSLYSFFGLSYLIKYCTRSVEEIFAMFIFVCFSMDAIFDTVHSEFSSRHGLYPRPARRPA